MDWREYPTSFCWTAENSFLDPPLTAFYKREENYRVEKLYNCTRIIFGTGVIRLAQMDSTLLDPAQFNPSQLYPAQLDPVQLASGAILPLNNLTLKISVSRPVIGAL
jgi:hypothetical protein